MRLRLLITVMALCACSGAAPRDAVQYNGRKQLLTLNNKTRSGELFEPPVVKKIAPERVLEGEIFHAKLFLSNNSLRIVNAFTGCTSVDLPSVDTLTLAVDGCQSPLYVKRDTVRINFTATKTGSQQSASITILTRGDDRVFRTYDYVLEYRVAAAAVAER